MNKTAPQPDTAGIPAAQQRRVIQAGEAGFREALSTAQNRGGPADKIDAMIRDASASAPQLPNGTVLSRMTLGIQRLMQKRATMPGETQISEMVLFFAAGPEVARCFDAYEPGPEGLGWMEFGPRMHYEGMVRDCEFMLDAETLESVGTWVGEEVRRFFPSPGPTAEPRTNGPAVEPAAAASDGGSAPCRTSPPATDTPPPPAQP